MLLIVLALIIVALPAVCEDDIPSVNGRISMISSSPDYTRIAISYSNINSLESGVAIINHSNGHIAIQAQRVMVIWMI